MSDQAGPGVVEGTNTGSGAVVLDVTQGETHHGRPISWVATAVIIVGFIVGGAALVPGPRWWLFWVGCGIVAVGGIFALAIRTFTEDWY